MKNLVLGAVAIAAAAVSMPASAAVVICPTDTGNGPCAATDENVLINQATAPTITGNTNNTGVAVLFTSTTETNLVGNAGGQASVGAADGLLQNLTFALQSGFGFRVAEFNLSPLSGNQLNEAISVVLNFATTTGTSSRTISIDTNGENRINISGNAGEVFTGITFTGNPATTGINDLRQLRLGGVAALTAPVPEPSTWAMMLLGMFGIGASMRTRRAKGVKLTYA
jgi:hypothetical protein